MDNNWVLFLFDYFDQLYDSIDICCLRWLRIIRGCRSKLFIFIVLNLIKWILCSVTLEIVNDEKYSASSYYFFFALLLWFLKICCDYHILIFHITSLYFTVFRFCSHVRLRIWRIFKISFIWNNHHNYYSTNNGDFSLKILTKAWDRKKEEDRKRERQRARTHHIALRQGRRHLLNYITKN